MPLLNHPKIVEKLHWKKLFQKKSLLVKAGFIALIILLVFFAIKVVIPAGLLARRMSLTPGMLLSFIFNTAPIKNVQGRTNFLIMGAGGSTHEGPNLTDSIMFVSLNKNTKESYLISLPRDIWDNALEGKINSAYAIGEYQEGYGVDIAREAVRRIVGQPIHYTIVIDFRAFKEMIDAVGGIDVNVERSFEDKKYPLENGAYEAATVSGQIYETISFQKGLTHMDGTTALKFSRSRNSTDPLEGTDFARSKRQQKIMVALKDKMMSKDTLMDFDKLGKIYTAIHRNIDTDIITADLPGLARLGLSFDDKKMHSLLLNEGTEEEPGFLINPPAGEYGAWVLIPRSGSWKGFQEYVKNEIEK